MKSDIAAKDKIETKMIPAIEPKHQRGNYWNAKGQMWNEAFVVLPDGLTAQDLTDHPVEVWSKIQQSHQLALNRFDRVFAVASDGTWAVEAIVGFADTSRVVLASPKVVKLPDPADAGLYSDGTYRVEPRSGGYVIMKVKDDTPLGDKIFQTAKQAEIEIARQYPTRKVA